MLDWRSVTGHEEVPFLGTVKAKPMLAGPEIEVTAQSPTGDGQAGQR